MSYLGVYIYFLAKVLFCLSYKSLLEDITENGIWWYLKTARRFK